MMDIAVAYNQFGFMGKEFLTWLWYVVENKEDQGFKDASGNPFFFAINDKITCENRAGEESVETVKIKGDGADLKEALVSLNKGALISELSLNVQYMDNSWDFVLKGENFNISGLKHPATSRPKSDEDLDGAILEKIYLWGIVPDLINAAFRDFYKKRTHDSWNNILIDIKEWINER